MSAVAKWQDKSWVHHPPYADPGLTGDLADIFESKDGRFKAVYWEARGPGKLLGPPRSDELICILEGEIVVELEGEQTTAGPGDIVLWVAGQPPILTIPQRVKAFCAAYRSGDAT